MSTSTRGALNGLGLALLLFGPAMAQEIEGTKAAGERTAVSAAAAGEQPHMKSGAGALLWSFLGTAAPAAATLPFIWEKSGTSGAKVAAAGLVGALLFGPSLGHFYADRPGRAAAGIAIRTLAGAVFTVGIVGGVAEGGATEGDNALAAVGAVVGGVAVVYDIVTAPRSAKTHNEELRTKRGGVDVGLMSGSHGLGLCATVSF